MLVGASLLRSVLVGSRLIGLAASAHDQHVWSGPTPST